VKKERILNRNAWLYALMAVALVLSVMLAVVTPSSATANTEYENIAYGKIVTASSKFSDQYGWQNVTDGDSTSDAGRWNSQKTRGTEWIQVDLGKEYRVSQIVITHWSNLNLGKEMTVSVSTDGKQYTEVKTLNGNTLLKNTINIATPVSARYVKVVENVCNSDWGYSINEIEVYSPDVLKAENVALNKRVYAKETFNGGYDVESRYVTDGDNTTRWSSEISPSKPNQTPYESWMMIDLEEEYALSEIAIRWYVNITFAIDYDVQVSNDGYNFTDVKSVKSGNYVAYQRVQLPSGTKGRYVRFAFHVPSEHNGYSILEIEAFGTKTGVKGKRIEPGEAEYAIYTGTMLTVEREDASGGYYTTKIDAADSVNFYEAPESYGVKIRYMSGNSEVNLYVDGGLATSARLPATVNDSFGEVTVPCYIAEGSKLTIVPDSTISLDCVKWLGKSEVDIPESVLFAKDAALTNAKVVDNVSGSISGSVVSANDNATVKFTGISDGYNVAVLKYKALNGANLTAASGQQSKTVKVSASESFRTTVVRFEGKIGSSFTLTTDKAMVLDTVELVKGNFSETVNVEIGEEARTSILLDGIWECTVGLYTDTVVPEYFDKTIPVPGMWDLADFSLGDDNGKALWYQKNIHLDSANFGGRKVVLRINKAYYGRTVYVNGNYVDKYWYNFTASEMDITRFLKAGDNKIQIKLGTFKSGSADVENPAHMGFDQEKTSYLPGIIDHVSLEIYKDPYVGNVQTDPDPIEGTLRVKTEILNGSSSPVSGKVVLSVYELGVYKDGKPAKEKLVNSVTYNNSNVAAGGKLVLDKTIEIPDYNKKDKAWTPENPYLYRLEIETAGDVESYRFGMRSFEIDKTTGQSLLNGDVYYLRGTNVCINRFFEDSQRSDHPWDENWVRTLFNEYKYVNWEGARFCVGFPPEFWYDICDEIGFLVVDEYPYWYCNDKSPRDGCKVDDLTEEVTSWVYERNNHPCVIFWDIQNESNTSYDLPLTAEVIQRVKGIDIQERVWENGWGPVQANYYPVEQHPYPFGFVENFSLSDIGTNKIYMPINNGTVANYINEYGWLWVDRDGNPTSLTAGKYALGNRGSNPEEYKMFYATGVAQLTERWRATRNYFGIFQFCGLSYSHPNGSGATSDVLCPDLTLPEIRPEVKEKMRGAFAPVGIVINDWNTGGNAGSVRNVPVILINDLNTVVSKTVTVSLYRNHKDAELELIESKSKVISAKALEVTKAVEFPFEIPDEAGNYTVIASYEVEGEKPITSTRYMVLGEKTATSLEYVKDGKVLNYVKGSGVDAGVFAVLSSEITSVKLNNKILTRDVDYEVIEFKEETVVVFYGKTLENMAIGTYPLAIRTQKSNIIVSLDVVVAAEFDAPEIPEPPAVCQHVFDKEIADEKYLASNATCTNKATYYKSCECGEKGNETFAYGEPLAHEFVKEVVDEKYFVSEATCTSKATYYKSCECGEKGNETFTVGEMKQHVYDKEVANEEYLKSEASCVLKATYYKSCECGAKGNETFTYGELNEHTFDDGVVTTKPTTEKEGEKTYTCSGCGQTKTEPVAKLEKDDSDDDSGSCASVAPVGGNHGGGTALMLLTLLGITALLIIGKKKVRG